MITKRQGIVVWLKNLKYSRKLKRYGHMIYTSRKQKYMLIYINQEDVEDIIKELEDLHFVKEVERSYRPYVEEVYESKIPEKPKKEHEIQSI
ncbi:hypothetical protein CEY16_01795 [Halalkalibacillus sediminis]|uniref:UPF0298 protein CEY16_01795 n=1 Tax=Halalkalibacillus sediminis TaxID=2018042 RepID=A0A2I0QW00_9BACI|nr:DUF2129 domain-containing protein [Halalkalibacillus sediminis]PKR78513.1 hypothetical protein CEY16_01795 [Halalkalibacillus sediminis]